MDKKSEFLNHRKTKCPTCKKLCSLDHSNAFRPFCSDRCKTADLAAWSDEQYSIPQSTPQLPDMTEVLNLGQQSESDDSPLIH